MADTQLTAEQEAQAQRIAEIISQNMQGEALRIARLLVSKPDAELFGKKEFELRDRVHEIGVKAFETGLGERKKGGTTGRA
jgi:hypothetical protein